MEDIIKKITGQIESMNNISKKVIKYGVRVFIILIFVSLVMLIVNKYFFGEIYEVTANAMDLLKSSFSVLTITVIGGLLMDYISKNEQ